MKALKGHGVSHISLKQQRRGRPLRASQELILETDAWVIVQELHLRPLRQPIGIQFAPYYDRILKGDLRAIYEYLSAIPCNPGKVIAGAPYLQNVCE